MTVETKKFVMPYLLDSLLADYKKLEDLIGENGLLKQLTNLLVEQADTKIHSCVGEIGGHDSDKYAAMYGQAEPNWIPC